MHSNVHRGIIYSCQGMHAIQVSINRGMNKEDVVSMPDGLLLSCSKE